MPSWILAIDLSWPEPQDSLESLEFAPIAAPNEVDWKHNPVLPRFIKTIFSFQSIQSLHLKSLARSTPDQRPRVHPQLLYFLINFSVSLTSVSKLATASLRRGALQSFGFPNESLKLAHCSTTPAPAGPKPQSLGCKAVSGLLVRLAGRTHLKRTINTLLMCQGTDWSDQLAGQRRQRLCCLPWCACACVEQFR